ncbi:hypothetical protein V9T40_013126 [Parthenolecanium corni]|uniref:Islet n=1 Tax=Parthenolecanium corni TaxID=536013 RepID=A0AAN9TMX5_9HEMI
MSRCVTRLQTSLRRLDSINRQFERFARQNGLFGTKCDKCSASFKKNDLVMRAKTKIYHMECFKCDACQKNLRPGDEFALRQDGLFCKEDHEELSSKSINNENNNNNNNITNNNNNTISNTNSNSNSSIHHHHNHNEGSNSGMYAPSSGIEIPATNISQHDSETCTLQGNPKDDEKRREEDGCDMRGGDMDREHCSEYHPANWGRVASAKERKSPSSSKSVSKYCAFLWLAGISPPRSSTGRRYPKSRCEMPLPLPLSLSQSLPEEIIKSVLARLSDATSAQVHAVSRSRFRTPIFAKTRERLFRMGDSSESGSNKYSNREVSRGGSTKIASDGKPTRVRTVLNEKQLHTLRNCYAANPRPDALMKEQLVEMTGLSPRVIRVWFQNKRCKDKKRTIAMKQQMQHEKTTSAALSPLARDIILVFEQVIRNRRCRRWLSNVKRKLEEEEEEEEKEKEKEEKEAEEEPE